MKRILLLLMALLVMSTVFSGYALADSLHNFDEKVAIELADHFIEEYENAIETLKMPNFDYVDRNDDTAMFLERLRYKIEFARSFHTNYENIELNPIEVLSYTSVDEHTILLEVYKSCKFHYVTAPVEQISGHGMYYFITIKNTSEGPMITALSTDSNDFKSFDDEMKALAKNENTSILCAAKELSDKKIAALPETLAFWEEQNRLFDAKYVEGDWDDVLIDDTTSSPNTRSVNVSFSRSSAVAYAQALGDQAQNYIFKRMSADCTNFVSQCLWAGYGGTAGYSLTNTTALKARVAANYRQTSTWYGRNYDSTHTTTAGAFMRVLELWNHATSNTGNGPRATGYNNGNVWTSLSVVPRTGDVLQFYSFSKNRYNHSVIVSSTNSPTLSNMLDRVWVCQHSGDYVDRPLSETLDDNGGITNGKIRLMRPNNSTFSS